MALNVKLGRNGGSEGPNWEDMVALNVKLRRMMALNARMWEWRLPERLKLRRGSGSERWNWRCDDDGSEHRNWKYDSQRQTENAMMALNAETEKRRWWLWTPKPKMRWWWLRGLKLKMQLWMSSWKCDDDGSERRNWEAIMMALNAETKNAMMMALNAETENATLNVKLKMWWWWLWTPKLRSDDDGSERQNGKWYNDPECRTMNMALNAKLRINGGFECQTKNNSHECQAKTTAVNANDNYEC